MKLLVVVQRYGPDVPGGAELAARLFATKLLGRGHAVEVLTSCARSYVDWANEYPAGPAEIEGVTVHRLAAPQQRDERVFGPLSARVVYGNKPVPMHLQREWMKAQGPYLPELVPWLAGRAASYDAAIFFTYLYFTTWAGLPAASGRTATVLHPTAHDEPPFYLPIFDPVFRQASALAFFTEEEEVLVRRRFRTSSPGRVIGIGQELEAHGDDAAFRVRYELGDDPYLLYAGRVDPAKGSDELFDFFAAYKHRRPGCLRLVIVGEPVKPLPAHPDVVVTGFVDDATKDSAMAGALALVHPSYFESFAMNLTEAWTHAKPALVQGRCDVLAGQARRSGGAIAYRGFAEFEAAVDLLVAEPDAARRLGEAGRRYVETTYRWDVVLDRYEALIDAACARG